MIAMFAKRTFTSFYELNNNPFIVSSYDGLGAGNVKGLWFTSFYEVNVHNANIVIDCISG